MRKNNIFKLAVALAAAFVLFIGGMKYTTYKYNKGIEKKIALIRAKGVFSKNRDTRILVLESLEEEIVELINQDSDYSYLDFRVIRCRDFIVSAKRIDNQNAVFSILWLSKSKFNSLVEMARELDVKNYGSYELPYEAEMNSLEKLKIK